LNISDAAYLYSQYVFGIKLHVNSILIVNWWRVCSTGKGKGHLRTGHESPEWE